MKVAGSKMSWNYIHAYRRILVNETLKLYLPLPFPLFKNFIFACIPFLQQFVALLMPSSTD